jgi:NADPH:quinone reductase-like Zn-dependent oxidoreductase
MRSGVMLKHRGRLILMAGLNAHPPFPVGAFYTKGCSMHGFAITNATPEELRDVADQINRLLAAGALKATPVFNLVEPVFAPEGRLILARHFSAGWTS